MRGIHCLAGLLLFFTSALAEPPGNKERPLFMHSLMFCADAFSESTPEDQMIPLLTKAVAEGEKVKVEFLDWVSPGLGKAWTEYYLPSHRFRITGMSKNNAGEIEAGALDQLRAIARWKQWEEFWLPRSEAIFNKLKVNR